MRCANCGRELAAEDEVSGGSAEITGSFTLQEARDLSTILLTGVMPLNLTLVK
jgi:preprotein translocase subunit SecD